MASKDAAAAVRTYLVALRDPSSLRDEDRLGKLRSQLEKASDELERLQLRQQIIDLESPSISQCESDFVAHAKAWADEHAITGRAFEAEGVPAQVLRRAGLATSSAGGRKSRRPGVRSRVTVDEVRAVIPRGSFTMRALQEASGASPAVIRKVINQELEEGRLKELGPDPDHRGPGRSPALFKKSR